MPLMICGKATFALNKMCKLLKSLSAFLNNSIEPQANPKHVNSKCIYFRQID